MISIMMEPLNGKKKKKKSKRYRVSLPTLGAFSMDFGFERRNFPVSIGCAELEGGMENSFKS